MKNSKKRRHDHDDSTETAEPAADGDSSAPTETSGTDSLDDPAITGADGVDGAGESKDRQPDSQSEREKYLRLAAEYENFRKRSAKERLESGARAQAELVRRIIDSLDDLARFAHVDPSSTDASTLVQGVEMVEKKMLRELSALGLEIINPVDQPFDPSLHEAVATEPTPAKEDDHLVARVFQPGYVFQSQLIRPARVVVKQWNG